MAEEIVTEVVDIEHFKNFWIEQQKHAKHMDSAAALACTTSAWAATLELQGLAEDAIVEALPVVLRAFEELPLDSLSSVEEALKGARRALENIPPV